MEDVHSGRMALPQIQVKLAERKFASGRFEIIETSADLGDPSVVESGEIRKFRQEETSEFPHPTGFPCHEGCWNISRIKQCFSAADFLQFLLVLSAVLVAVWDSDGNHIRWKSCKRNKIETSSLPVSRVMLLT